MGEQSTVTSQYNDGGQSKNFKSQAVLTCKKAEFEFLILNMASSPNTETITDVAVTFWQDHAHFQDG